MFQLNGITMQPKIGSDFITQYGDSNSATAATTMANVTNPAAQNYNIDKVTANTDSANIAHNLAKYDTAQPTILPPTATKSWIG